MGGGGWLGSDGFRVRVFFVLPPPNMQNCPPLCMCWKLLFIGKNVVWTSKLVP
jgi:hypothetical protein